MYREIAQSHVPRGYTLTESRRKAKTMVRVETYWQKNRRSKNPHFHGHTIGEMCSERKFICVPKLDNAAALFVFFHELGHIHLGHRGKRYKLELPENREEYEAEQFAIGMMRAHGIPVPKWIVLDGKAYIKSCIQSDTKLDKPIFAPARRYVNGTFPIKRVRPEAGTSL